MKIFARTLDDSGMCCYLPVELPPRLYEICLVSDGDEPGGRFAFIVTGRAGGGLVLCARDAQILVAPKASNSVYVAAVEYQAGMPHGRKVAE